MTHPRSKPHDDLVGLGSARPVGAEQDASRAGPAATASSGLVHGGVEPEGLSALTKPPRIHPAQGWAPLAMRCPECEGPDAHCLTCGGTGAHPDSDILSEGLFIDDVLVATIEAFADPGAHYAKAVGLDGDYHCGDLPTHADAAEWCEKVTGYGVPAHRTAR